MMPNPIVLLRTALLLAGATAGMNTAARAQGEPRTPAEQAKMDGGVMPYTAADVRFMQGMIGHHSQAVVMAGWAPTHGASESLKILAGRIDVAQRDEIAFMQRWLGDRKLAVPDAAAQMQHSMSMPGMAMGELMPGMLTPEQMSELDRARGPEFDRLFLTYMIQHHQGALSMVDQLFGTQGAGQELYIFRFASDVSADQFTEIDRMRLMLATPPQQRNTP
jgi:uncharacterized protein (DUF305 family)